ncbi:MAG: hypothetical protein NT051_06275 [Candidatus Micrarchaeota archaeon]|nr:hypothetical protein [Candidatus Micrarchaeota archaeon]
MSHKLDKITVSRSKLHNINRQSEISVFFRKIANAALSGHILIKEEPKTVPFTAKYSEGKLKLYYQDDAILYCNNSGKLLRKAGIEEILAGPLYDSNNSRKLLWFSAIAKGIGQIHYIVTEKGILAVAANEKRTRAKTEWASAIDGSKIMKYSPEGTVPSSSSSQSFACHLVQGGTLFAITPTTLFGVSGKIKFDFNFTQHGEMKLMELIKAKPYLLQPTR